MNDATQAEAKNLADALRVIAENLPLSPHWAEPEPDGVDLAFSNVICALSGETTTPAAATAAVQQFLEPYVESDEPKCHVCGDAISACMERADQDVDHDFSAKTSDPRRCRHCDGLKMDHAE